MDSALTNRKHRRLVQRVPPDKQEQEVEPILRNGLNGKIYGSVNMPTIEQPALEI